MPSYSSSLRLLLPAVGGDYNNWGNYLNKTIDLIEDAISGIAPVDLTGLNTYTLTSVQGDVDEARKPMLVFSGTPAATVTIVVPAIHKQYFVLNTTNQPLTIGIAGGSTGTIAANSFAFVYCDGVKTNALTLVLADNRISKLTLTSDNVLSVLSGNNSYRAIMAGTTALQTVSGPVTFLNAVTIGHTGGNKGAFDKTARTNVLFGTKSKLSCQEDDNLVLYDSVGSILAVSRDALTYLGNAIATESWTNASFLQTSQPASQIVTGQVVFSGPQGSNLKTSNAPASPTTGAGGDVPNTWWVDRYYARAGDYATNPALNSVNEKLQNQVNNRVVKTGDEMTGGLTITGNTGGFNAQWDGSNPGMGSYVNYPGFTSTAQGRGGEFHIQVQEHVGSQFTGMFSLRSSDGRWRFLGIPQQGAGRINDSDRGELAYLSDLPLDPNKIIMGWNGYVGGGDQSIPFPRGLSGVDTVIVVCSTQAGGNHAAAVINVIWWNNSSVRVRAAWFDGRGAGDADTYYRAIVIGNK